MVAPETARAPSLPRTRAEMKIVESRVVCGVWKTAVLNHVHAFQPFLCSRGVCNRDLFDRRGGEWNLCSFLDLKIIFF